MAPRHPHLGRGAADSPHARGAADPRYSPGAANPQQGRDVPDRAWLWFLVALAATSVVYVLASSGPVFNLLGLAAVAAILAGARRQPRGRRAAWYCFAAGQALFVTGDVLAYNYARLFGTPLPFPSVADPFYLACYPSLVAGLVIVIRRRNRGRDVARIVDSLIVALAAGGVSWIYLIEPQIDDPSLGTLAKLTSITYPMMDLLLLGVAVRLMLGAGRSGASFDLLVAAIGALFATDAIYGWLVLHGGYDGGGVLDAGWLAFYGLLGAAALHPSARATTEEVADPPERLTARRLLLLGAATLLAPTIQVTRLLLGQDADVRVTASLALALLLLVAARVTGIVRQHALVEPGRTTAGGEVGPARSPDAPQAIDGYRPLRVVGRGGMGIVYAARPPDGGSEVALKVITPALLERDDVRARFEREADISATLEHPHIVPVLARGEHDGVAFLVMPLVDGPSLRDELAAHGPLPLERALPIVMQICAALDAAHARGIVHRDVKSANVLLAGNSERPHAYLLDFGVGAIAGDVRQTRSGEWLGSTDYVAPEVIEGADADARTDVYALGCVLYEMLTGAVPYPRPSDAGKLFAHLNAPPPRVELADPARASAISEIVARALAKDPAARYPSAGALAAALSAAVGS